MVALALVAVVAGVGWWRAHRRAIEHQARSRSSALLVTRLTANYADLQRKKDEIFDRIESIVAERTTALNFYHVQAAEHANAQDMMMREIASYEHQYEGLRQRVAAATTLDAAHAAAARRLRRNASLALLADEFRGSHVPDQVAPVLAGGCVPGGAPTPALDSPAPTP